MIASRPLALFAALVLALCSTSCASGPRDIVVIDDQLMKVTMLGAENNARDGVQEIDVLIYRAEAKSPERRFAKFQWALFHDLNRNEKLELSEGLAFATSTPTEPQSKVEVFGAPTRARGRVWLEAFVLMETGDTVRRIAPVPGW